MSSQILGHTESLPTEQLTTYHQNPRQGDTETIAQSLRTNGQFRPLVVNKGTHTGRPYEVLAGNHTLLAARTLDGTQDAFPRLDCYVIDVEEDHARRLQVQENITAQIVEAIHEHLKPEWVGCAITATHGCMTIRGVRDSCSDTVTFNEAGQARPIDHQAFWSAHGTLN